MKRALSLILCAVMLLTALCGCTTLEKDETGEYDKGAIIPMYLGNEMYNFDPQVEYLNDSNVKILSLYLQALPISMKTASFSLLSLILMKSSTVTDTANIR